MSSGRDVMIFSQNFGEQSRAWGDHNAALV